jgi:hypothetical protein
LTIRSRLPLMLGTIRIVQAVLMLGVAGPLTPAIGQAPTEDVTAVMQGELALQVQDGCGGELARHCADVTPGEGRLLACLYAHGDMLSGRCELALYDSAARLERAIGAITYVAAREALREGRGGRRARGSVPQGSRRRAQPQVQPGAEQPGRGMTRLARAEFREARAVADQWRRPVQRSTSSNQG